MAKQGTQWLRHAGALALALGMTACSGNAPDDRGATRTEPPGQGEVQHRGDNGPAPPSPARDARNVIVNDVRLSDDEVLQIEQTYKVTIVDANYWYDPMSGAWGIKGGPTRGFVYPGLRLGGPLQADASGTAPTGTWVNGRQLHPDDVAGLRRCMVVQQGRFWVLANGIGGWEGGPAAFNLYDFCGGGQGSKGWVCNGGSCGTDRTVTGAYAYGNEGGGQGGVYTDRGLILTPN